jgi:hypothetical protein
MEAWAAMSFDELGVEVGIVVVVLHHSRVRCQCLLPSGLGITPRVVGMLRMEDRLSLVEGIPVKHRWGML